MSTFQVPYIRGIHRYSFRTNEAAEIIGVRIVRPPGYGPRICFEVKFEDGVIDYIPIYGDMECNEIIYKVDGLNVIFKDASR